MQPYPNPNYYTPQSYNVPQNTYNVAQPQLAKIVQDFNNITIGDIPTNGTPAFFVKSDYTEIQARQWTDDGRVKSLRYTLEAKDEPDPLQDIKQRLEAIEEKLTTRTRKKVEADEQ